MRGIPFAGAMLLLAALTGTAAAQENLYQLPRLTGAYPESNAPFKLAANETDSAPMPQEHAAPAAKPAKFEPPLLTGSNVHKYLGLATVGAAAATFLTHKDRCESPSCMQIPRKTHNAHANLGRATAVLAAATVASGLISHWDDFSLEDGIADPDNQHVLLGISGAALMAYAINKSARSNVPVNHAGMAELGALSMIVAIKLTW